MDHSGCSITGNSGINGSNGKRSFCSLYCNSTFIASFMNFCLFYGACVVWQMFSAAFLICIPTMISVCVLVGPTLICEAIFFLPQKKKICERYRKKAIRIDGKIVHRWNSNSNREEKEKVLIQYEYDLNNNNNNNINSNSNNNNNNTDGKKKNNNNTGNDITRSDKNSGEKEIYEFLFALPISHSIADVHSNKKFKDYIKDYIIGSDPKNNNDYDQQQQQKARSANNDTSVVPILLLEKYPSSGVPESYIHAFLNKKDIDASTNTTIQWRLMLFLCGFGLIWIFVTLWTIIICVLGVYFLQQPWLSLMLLIPLGVMSGSAFYFLVTVFVFLTCRKTTKDKFLQFSKKIH